MKYWILLFVILPAIELALLIQVGTLVGVLNTFLLIVFTGILGAYLARSQGLQTWIRINQSLAQGIVPTDEMMNGALILVGGVVLLTPGLITDTVGFLLLIPLTRNWLKYYLLTVIQRKTEKGEVITLTQVDYRRDD